MRWRGYLQNALQTKVSPAGASLRVGLIWGFRHLPLWFLSSFISYFYNRPRNILVAMWIYFLFNFLTRFASIDGVALLTYLSAVCGVSAAILVLMDRDRFLMSPKSVPAGQ